MKSKQADVQAGGLLLTRGLVARTDALWNKLACPREPTGSLSEAIYSPHTQRLTAGPASRASGWPPNRGPKSLAQPERPAANPAGACDARTRPLPSKEISSRKLWPAAAVLRMVVLRSCARWCESSEQTKHLRCRGIASPALHFRVCVHCAGWKGGAISFDASDHPGFRASGGQVCR